jgi:hypothetical protein
MIIQDLIHERQQTDNESKFNDPLLQRKMDYAFGHYPGYQSRSEAFLKWLMRGIEHSETNDQDHESKIRNLEKTIQRLQKKVSRLENTVGTDNVMSVMEQIWQ